MGELPHLPVISHQGATLNFETLERQIGELQERLQRHALIPQDSGWVAPTLEHSWTNLGGTFLTAAYRKQDNEVRLRGTLTGGGSGTTAFVLPAGFRPTAKTFQAMPQSGFGAAFVQVSAAGEVLMQYNGAEKTVGLDGVTFTID